VVIQQLQMVKALLGLEPPDVKSALRELDIAMTVAMQEYEKYHKLEQQPPMPPDFGWREPIRPNDELLKEFGW